MLAVAVVAIGSLQLSRSGYSVDEEFTVFAVRGIQASGLPILPSGLLYDRGLAYSYASWLAGFITGSELPAYRAISLACAAIAILLVCGLIRRLGDRPAVGAALLVMSAVPFWATATSGRFYAPFLALYLATLFAMRSNVFVIAILRVLLSSDTRARLHARSRSRHWLDDREGGTQTLVVGRLGDRRRSRRRSARTVLAPRARAFQRRDDGPPVLPLAGREPLRAARRSPVHDSTRRDGDRLDRRAEAGVDRHGRVVVGCGDDRRLFDRARYECRAAVARAGAVRPGRRIAISDGHVLAHRDGRRR